MSDFQELKNVNFPSFQNIDPFWALCNVANPPAVYFLASLIGWQWAKVDQTQSSITQMALTINVPS